jgi:hypothetical protein
MLRFQLVLSETFQIYYLMCSYFLGLNFINRIYIYTYIYPMDSKSNIMVHSYFIQMRVRIHQTLLRK